MATRIHCARLATRSHNPKVEGSNPSPATIDAAGQRPGCESAGPSCLPVQPDGSPKARYPGRSGVGATDCGRGCGPLEPVHFGHPALSAEIWTTCSSPSLVVMVRRYVALSRSFVLSSKVYSPALLPLVNVFPDPFCGTAGNSAPAVPLVILASVSVALPVLTFAPRASESWNVTVCGLPGLNATHAFLSNGARKANTYRTR